MFIWDTPRHKRGINATILPLKDCSYQETFNLKKVLYNLKIGNNKKTCHNCFLYLMLLLQTWLYLQIHLVVVDDTSSFPDGMPTNERNVVLLVHTLNTALQVPKLMIVAIMIDTSPPQLQICILTQELSFQLSRTLRVILLISLFSLLCNLCLLCNTPLSFLLPWILRVILLIILLCHNLVGIQSVTVLLQ